MPDPAPEAPYDGPVIAVPVYAGVNELELSLMVTLARLCGGEQAIRTVNRSRASIVTAGRLVMTPHVLYAALPEPAALFIPGGPGAARAARDPLLKSFLQMHLALPVGVSGSGVLLAGEGGLLTGRSVGCAPEFVDTVWNYEPAEVQPGQVVSDGHLTTTPAGFTAWQAAQAVALALWNTEVVREAVARIEGR